MSASGTNRHDFPFFLPGSPAGFSWRALANCPRMLATGILPIREAIAHRGRQRPMTCFQRSWRSSRGGPTARRHRPPSRTRARPADELGARFPIVLEEGADLLVELGIELRAARHGMGRGDGGEIGIAQLQLDWCARAVMLGRRRPTISQRRTGWARIFARFCRILVKVWAHG